MTGVLVRGSLDTQRSTMGMGAQSKGHAFEDANCKPRGEASEKPTPADTLIWTCSVWNYEKILFCSLICPAWVVVVVIVMATL